MKSLIFSNPAIYMDGEPVPPASLAIQCREIVITVEQLYLTRVDSVARNGSAEAKRMATLAGVDTILIDYILYQIDAPKLQAQTASLRTRLQDPTMHVCLDCLLMECVKIGIDPFVTVVPPEYKDKHKKFMEEHATFKMN